MITMILVIKIMISLILIKVMVIVLSSIDEKLDPSNSKYESEFMS